jgi:alanine dehydrogenase
VEPVSNRWRNQRAVAPGLIKESEIAGEIGEVITGRKPGRLSEGEITLFDSTGISLQDSATVPLEYERAVAAGVGVEKKMISTRRSGTAPAKKPAG